MSDKKISRKTFLKNGLSIAAGLFLTIPFRNTLFASEQRAVPANLTPIKVQAKSVIFIFLNGGPCHLDTFDPKINSGRDYSGSYTKPITTNNPNLIINEKMVKLSQIADRYSIIRSMSHNSNAHEVGQYVIFTGDMSKGSVVYPSFGATISYMKRDSYKGVLPPFITIPSGGVRFNENGFLDVSYQSYRTGGAPEKDLFEVDGIITKGVTTDDLQRKRDLLDEVSSFADKNVDQQSAEIMKSKVLQDNNYDLILGETRKVFDLSAESEETRKAYGMNRLGQSCLVARRLVEAGTPAIVVNSTGWDTHKEHFKRMNNKLPELDSAVSALILDLEERGLLDETIVMVGGEFGRTPRVDWAPPWNGGRGHYGDAFSFLVAGGGFKGGEIVGETDKQGIAVVDRVVYPGDLIGSVYYLMGIDPTIKLPHPQMGEVPIIPPMPPAKEASMGILKEIMREDLV